MKPKHYYKDAKRKRYIRYQCRCSRLRCQVRQTFKRHPDDYIRSPRCWSCGGTRWRIDWYRMVRIDSHAKKNACRCLRYHFPHRRYPGCP